MNKIIIVTLITCLFLSCGKEEVENPENDLTLLEGQWVMTAQYIDDEPIASYTQVRNYINISDDEIIWIDTVRFGTTLFSFTKSREADYLNSFKLKSENVRELYGGWYFNPSKDSINIRSISNDYMGQDTLLNDYRFTFRDFINFKYKIKSLTNSSLVLENGGQKLEFVKSD